MNTLFQCLETMMLLITKNGFLFKVDVIEKDGTKMVFFFLNKELKHRTWKLTETQGLILNEKEYYRLKLKVGLKEHSITEQSHPNEFKSARAIAEKVYADPYFGLTPIQKKVAEINKSNGSSGATIGEFVSLRKAV